MFFNNKAFWGEEISLIATKGRATDNLERNCESVIALEQRDTLLESPDFRLVPPLQVLHVKQRTKLLSHSDPFTEDDVYATF